MTYEDLAAYWVAGILSPRAAATQYCHIRLGKIELDGFRVWVGSDLIAMVHSNPATSQYTALVASPVSTTAFAGPFLTMVEKFLPVIQYPYRHVPLDLRDPKTLAYKRPKAYRPQLREQQGLGPVPAWLDPFVAAAERYARKSVVHYETDFRMTYARHVPVIGQNAKMLAEMLQEPFPAQMFTLDFLLRPYPREYNMYAVYWLSDSTPFDNIEAV